MVQVRQKTDHKRTFFYLEQMLLKSKAHRATVRISEVSDGLDFFFATKQDARALVDFILQNVPCKYKMSEKLISHDAKSNVYNYKYTFSVEIVPVCKDQVICLPAKLARSLGNINQICVCTRVTQTIHLIDSGTCQVAEIRAPIYYRTPFLGLCTQKQLVEFVVLNVDIIAEKDKPHDGSGISAEGGKTGRNLLKHSLADVWVVRASELGVSDNHLHCRSHLGHLLNPGDTVLGFDFTNSNVNDTNLDALNSDKLPDVVIVKKVFGDRNARKRKRNWKLKRLNADKETMDTESLGRDDFTDFLEDLEEDAELRRNVNIYVDKTKTAVDLDDTDDEGVPRISLQEMMEEMNIEDEEMKEEPYEAEES